jgi:ATP/maltotriose-dependent transcriptional regulator MalT
MVKVAPVDIGTVSNLLHVANHIDGDAKPFLQRASCTTPVLHVFDLCTSLRLGGRLVARPRLFEPLNSGLRRKLTLIAAPAGYGKTIQAVAWLRARRHLAAIRADDRRFMVGKAHTFLNDAAGAKVSHETALALTERIERWIAGLRLAALSMRGRSEPAAVTRSFKGTQGLVTEFLGEEMLERQPSTVQGFDLDSVYLRLAA